LTDEAELVVEIPEAIDFVPGVRMRQRSKSKILMPMIGCLTRLATRRGLTIRWCLTGRANGLCDVRDFGTLLKLNQKLPDHKAPDHLTLEGSGPLQMWIITVTYPLATPLPGT
jgi:hypothetical protein